MPLVSERDALNRPYTFDLFLLPGGRPRRVRLVIQAGGLPCLRPWPVRSF
jgi:hypothetical protein